MGSHMSRFTAQTPSCHHTVRSGKVPSFLYLKQGIFYYRCRLPIDLVHRLDKSEVRISLRTGHRAQALRLARDLHTRFQRALGKPNSLIFLCKYYLQEQQHTLFCLHHQHTAPV